MKCIVCDSKCRVIDSRPSKYFITTRSYECEECFTRFKTQEKIIFESIPAYIRNNFLDTGRRKP